MIILGQVFFWCVSAWWPDKKADDHILIFLKKVFCSKDIGVWIPFGPPGVSVEWVLTFIFNGAKVTCWMRGEFMTVGVSRPFHTLVQKPSREQFCNLLDVLDVTEAPKDP